jgi:DNA-binding NarL/FixJ family response regulator
MTNILLADDHNLFRDSMAAWLNQLDGHVHVQHASSYGEVVDLVASGAPLDLILLDLYMPGMKGAISVEQIYRLDGDAPIAMMSADENVDVMRRCLDAGAVGYLPKSSDGNVILAAIRIILAGGSYFPSSIAESSDEIAFNNKHHEVLLLLADGLCNKEIASRTSLSPGTVKQYVSEILKKLSVSNRTQAGIKARKLGLIEH